MRKLLFLGLASLAVSLLSSTAPAQDKTPPPVPKATVERLIKDLKQTDNDEVRVQAAMGLADYGPLAEPALGVLVGALGSKNEDVRLNAAIALGKIGKAAVPALSEMLDGADKDMRFYAIWALGWVGPDAKAVAPTLVKAMADKDEN